MHRYLGPAQSSDGGDARVAITGHVWYDVPSQEACVFCGEALVYVAGKHDPMYMVVAFVAGMPYWCHQRCRLDAKRDSSPAMARHTKRPRCARCGEPWRQHVHATDESHGLCGDLSGYYTTETVKAVA